MEKKILAVRLLVDEKQVHQAASIFSEDIISKEDLQRRFFDREPVTIDVSDLGEDALAMTIAFTSMIILKEEEENGTN